MTKPRFALNYAQCTTAELKKFVRARTGRKVNSQWRSTYIKALKEADAAATFRFLDLPPEMRNAVYEELLAPRVTKRFLKDKDDMSCWPQILATCKLVHEEAESILYSHPTMTISLYCVFHLNHPLNQGIDHKEVCVTIDLEYKNAKTNIESKSQNHRSPRPDRPFSASLRNWPAALLKVQSLKIIVEPIHLGYYMPESMSLEAFAEISHLLYSLASALGAAPKRKLKQLSVEFTSLKYMQRILDDFGKVDDLLWPLRRIGHVEKLECSGVDTIHEELLRIDTKEQNRASCNLVDEYHALCHQASDAIEIARVAGAEAKRRVLEVALEDLMAATEFTGFMTEGWERYIFRRMENMRALRALLMGVSES